MKEEFILGGYFVVIPKIEVSCNENQSVSKKQISVSKEICDIVPDTWALDWVDGREEDIARIKDILKINSSEFLELEKWTTKEFEKGNFGWQYGFSELTKAKEFAELFLTGIKEYVVLSIGLTKSEAGVFLEREKPQGNTGSSLVYDKLNEGKKLDIRNLLGFDLLGFDLGEFYSCMSYELDKYSSSEFDFFPNMYGFYDDYESVLNGARDISGGLIDAEPALWQPWAICLEETLIR